MLYITGWGHSGSTLLARLLVTAPQIISHGELKYFIEYYERDETAKIPNAFFCTCGNDFAACEFWCQVRNTMRDTPPPSRCTGLMARLRTARQFFVGRRMSRSEHDSELSLARATFASSDKHAKYLLDPSKDFTRLMRLLMIPEINVIPIYLVRDVRGVAYSYRKPQRNQLSARPKSFFESMLTWTAIHWANRLIFWTSGIQPLHISYAGFCANPRAYIDKLNRLLGVEIMPVGEIRSSSLGHYIGGNQMKDRPVTEIRDDQEWRPHERRWHRMLYRLSGTASINRKWACDDTFLSS